MADYIFTQNGDGNVQIGDITGIPHHVNTALKWALEHNFQSVAAQYARTLALEIVRLREDDDRMYAALKLAQARAGDYEAEIERLTAELAAGQKITGDTSDGYHTFNELYHHRSVLFSVICNDRPEMAWKSRKHHDGTMYDGMFIVGIETPDGQATYHYDVDPYWDIFRVKELDSAPEWDGHTSAQAIDRIGRLSYEEWEEAYEAQSGVAIRLETDLSAMTADRDAWRKRAEAAEADLSHIAQEMYDDDSDNLRGDWYPCEVCTKPAWDNTNETCWACFAEAQARGGKTAFEWRGPEEEKQ